MDSKKKMIQQANSFVIPLYGGRIDVVISNEDDVKASAARNFNVHDGALECNAAVCLGRSNPDNRIYPVLFSIQITPGMIAHEAKHLVNSIFTDIGAHLDMKNDEHECYLLMWIVNRIWEVKTKFDKKVNAYESKCRINENRAQNESCINGNRHSEDSEDNSCSVSESSEPDGVHRYTRQETTYVKLGRKNAAIFNAYC